MKEIIGLNNEQIKDDLQQREKWDREFDNDYGELKGANPEKYKKLKDKYISERTKGMESENLAEEMTALNVRQEQKTRKDIDDIWSQLEWLNSRHEDLIEEYKKSLVESTTGLKRRENLYKEMDKNLERLLGVSGFTEKSDPEVLELLKSVKPDVYNQEKLGVMMGDMAYLSLANEAGHREGDKLLGRVGGAVKKELPDASRHGGDEFTALLLTDKESTKEKVKNLEQQMKKLKNLPILEKYELEPKMDIGTAHISEAFSVFNKVVGKMEKSRTGKKELGKIDVLKEFEDIWLDIADKRSFIKKGKDRIKLLLLKKSDKEMPGQYRELKAFLLKGGYNISDEELEEMADRKAAGESEDEVVFEYIKGKELESLRGLTMFERVRAEEILKTAEPKILE